MKDFHEAFTSSIMLSPVKNMKEEMRSCWNTLLLTEHYFGVEKRIIIKNMNKLITLLKFYKQSGSHPAVVSFFNFPSLTKYFS